MQAVRANQHSDFDLSQQDHFCRVLTRLLQAGLWIIGVLCLYFLSFGPVLRYSAQPVFVPAPAPGARSALVQAVPYPMWVSTLYSPAFCAIGHDPRPEYRHHDLLNSYKRYLQWWTP